jgi:hypothetical protein
MKKEDQVYEEEKSKLEKLRTQKKEKDTRVKTEDVTKTKGLSFEDFDLPSDLQLVRLNQSHRLGDLRNGLRQTITYTRGGYPSCT